MENPTSGENYRKNLAEALKSTRTVNKEKAIELLDSEKGTERYEEASKEHHVEATREKLLNKIEEVESFRDRNANNEKYNNKFELLKFLQSQGIIDVDLSKEDTNRIGRLEYKDPEIFGKAIVSILENKKAEKLHVVYNDVLARVVYPNMPSLGRKISEEDREKFLRKELGEAWEGKLNQWKEYHIRDLSLFIEPPKSLRGEYESEDNLLFRVSIVDNLDLKDLLEKYPNIKVEKFKSNDINKSQLEPKSKEVPFKRFTDFREKLGDHAEYAEISYKDKE